MRLPNVSFGTTLAVLLLLLLNIKLLVSANEGYPVTIIHLNDFHARYLAPQFD